VTPAVTKVRDLLARFRGNRQQSFRQVSAVAVACHEAVIGAVGVAVEVGEAVEQRADRADRWKVGGVELERIIRHDLRIARARK
jgi:hypothetical protein